MKNIIILKGESCSGKSTILKTYLPQLLGVETGKRSFIYNNKRILIYRMSLHENRAWKSELEGICKKEYDIFIIASWTDELAVSDSSKVADTIEQLLKNHLDGYHIIDTIYTEIKIEQLKIEEDNIRCANAIKKAIDNFIK